AARPPAPSASDRASSPGAPAAMTAHRQACCAQVARPAAGRLRCQSHAPVATTSQHWPRSPETQPPPLGTIGRRRPPPPPALADPQIRLGPSLLASSPVSSLNHNPRFKGIPSDSVSCGKTLGAEGGRRTGGAQVSGWIDETQLRLREKDLRAILM